MVRLTLAIIVDELLVNACSLLLYSFIFCSNRPSFLISAATSADIFCASGIGPMVWSNR